MKKRKPIKDRCCMNAECPLYGQFNTSFIEGYNLTIRHGNSYLQRKTASHSREHGHLDAGMALQMRQYNFIRPHSALKFGKETGAPAMQAGIVSKKLSFRDIFTYQGLLFLCLILLALILREKLTRRAGCSTLTRISHQPSAAAAYLPAPSRHSPLSHLDVLSSTPSISCGPSNANMQPFRPLHYDSW